MHPLPFPAPVCEIEVLYDGKAATNSPAESQASSDVAGQRPRGDSHGQQRRAQGPARVATDSYRRNWSSVFGGGRKTGDYSVN